MFTTHHIAGFSVAVTDREKRSITTAWYRRVWGYRLFSDPQTADFIKSIGIKLIGYRELKQIRGSFGQNTCQA